MRSVCLSYCVFVCLSASISPESLDRSSRFLCRCPVAVARSSSGGVAIPGRSLMSMNALFVNAVKTNQISVLSDAERISLRHLFTALAIAWPRAQNRNVCPIITCSLADRQFVGDYTRFTGRSTYYMECTVARHIACICKL